MRPPQAAGKDPRAPEEPPSRPGNPAGKVQKAHASLRRPLSARPTRTDRGSIAPLLPLLALLILLLGGLVIDAARQLNARAKAIAYAEEAARAGAGAIDLGSENLELITVDAGARVEEYCTRVLQDTRSGVKTCHLIGIETIGEDDPRPLVVHVRVTTQIPSTLLGLVGVKVFTAAGDGRARPFEGVLQPDDIRTGTGDG
ncbi:MAG: hypothetical protein QG608_140 [Actinomycetota bacterium]|nr:hypothetical protein [Actinomycetota bacterium]